MPAFPQSTDSAGTGFYSIALIGPHEQRRKAVAAALVDCQGDARGNHHPPSSVSGVTIREFSKYPSDLRTLPEMLEKEFDVVIVELDSDPEYALSVVGSIGAQGPAIVMVYSALTDVELVVRSMRAGAREFLTLPLSPATVAEALTRASVRRPSTRQPKKTIAKLFVFLGAKGGCGVTTVASNFAVSMAQESSQNTLLIDLGLPLGDVAINLGMTTEYSTSNAFQESSRLDGNFLSSLLAKHSSGLAVLAAPNEFPRSNSSNEALDKLLAVSRQSFDNIVVDAGARIDLRGTSLFDESANIYLITQVGVSELRNANRMISQFFATRGHKLQIVLNRFMPHALGLDEEHVTKTLTLPAQWRIPDDYASARRTQKTATPLALEDSPISRVIRQMARTACGLPADSEKKKGFSLFGRVG